jgi:hypothetical protein
MLHLAKPTQQQTMVTASFGDGALVNPQTCRIYPNDVSCAQIMNNPILFLNRLQSLHPTRPLIQNSLLSILPSSAPLSTLKTQLGGPPLRPSPISPILLPVNGHAIPNPSILSSLTAATSFRISDSSSAVARASCLAIARCSKKEPRRSSRSAAKRCRCVASRLRMSQMRR